MIDKDIRILDFLKRLKITIDFKQLEIVDHWPSDLCAFGIQKGEKMVYISIFNSSNSLEMSYDYDLELIDNEEETKVNVLKRGRGVEEGVLVDELRDFLDV